jgi:hypothetical protein
MVAAVGGVALWAFLPSGPPDLVYSGHPLSYWVGGDISYPDIGFYPVLDSNAVPYLAEALKRQDGLARRDYQKVWWHLPGWFEARLPVPRRSALEKARACYLFSSLGADARPAIPELIRVFRGDENDDVRSAAAFALCNIANRDDKDVVDALSSATKQPASNFLWLRNIVKGALDRLAPGSADKVGVTNTP